MESGRRLCSLLPDEIVSLALKPEKQPDQPPMRGIAIVLIAMTIGAALLAGTMAAERSGHFDPDLTRRNYPCSLDPTQEPEPLWADFDGWFGGPLRGANEPSLYQQAQIAPSQQSLRLTFLPAFSDPLIVRIDDLQGPRPRLTAIRYQGQVVATSNNTLVRYLTAEEVRPLRSLVASTNVLSLPPDSCLSGIDGVIYLIEASGPDGYHFINRWGVSDGPVYEVANEMYRLTGWPNGPQGPDRQRARFDF